MKHESVLQNYRLAVAWRKDGLPLKISPTKSKNTLYLRVPPDIRDLHNITPETPFTLEVKVKGAQIQLVYINQQTVKRRESV